MFPNFPPRLLNDTNFAYFFRSKQTQIIETGKASGESGSRCRITVACFHTSFDGFGVFLQINENDEDIPIVISDEDKGEEPNCQSRNTRRR